MVRDRFKKAKRIVLIIFSVLLVIILVIWGYNAIQYQQVKNVASTVDDTFTPQETGKSNVEKLGNLFTIYDKDSYDWVYNNIKMTDNVRKTLLPDKTYQGTSLSKDYAPTFTVVDIQYENRKDILSYLATFNVSFSNGITKTYFVKCEYDDDTLTSINIY